MLPAFRRFGGSFKFTKLSLTVLYLKLKLKGNIKIILNKNIKNDKN
jgi:hypothetical protein